VHELVVIFAYIGSDMPRYATRRHKSHFVIFYKKGLFGNDAMVDKDRFDSLFLEPYEFNKLMQVDVCRDLQWRSRTIDTLVVEFCFEKRKGTETNGRHTYLLVLVLVCRYYTPTLVSVY